MRINTYEQAVKYLESFIGKVRFRIDSEFLRHHDPLERMRTLLSLLGDPQEKFPSVLIGGTAGKGSTAYLISHILTTVGYKTGLTISPHLQKVNERIQINGKPISDGKFVQNISSILLSIRKMSEMRIGAPSYFEILIAMAFKYFCDQKVDIAVVEVGMGGEYDATNTLYPLIAVLTNVSLDHTNILGGTVQKIAKTKAGIIKGLRIKDNIEKIHHSSFIIRHSMVVTGAKQPSVIKIIKDRCKEAGVKLFRLEKDFSYKIKKENHEGSVFDLTIDNDRVLQLNDLSISLLGDYQVENASLAIETVLQLKKFGFEVTNNYIRTALKTAFFPGRFEIVYLSCHPKFISVSSSIMDQGNKMPKPASPRLDSARLAEGKQVQHNKEKTLILDGAHNPTKMKAFLATLKKLFPREQKVFIIGFKFDKDIAKMLKQILKVADGIIVTEFNRATDMSLSASAKAESIKYQISRIKYRGKIILEKDSKKALDKALSLLTTQQPARNVSQPARNDSPSVSGESDERGHNNSTIIVVTGSLYLVGEIRDFIVL